jgi:hypothetical protein
MEGLSLKGSGSLQAQTKITVNFLGKSDTRELRRDHRLSHTSQASDVKTSSRTLSSGESDSVLAKICSLSRAQILAEVM